MSHPTPDPPVSVNLAEAMTNPDFLAGAAWAAHMMRHSVDAAHGHAGWVDPAVEPKACCREAVLVAVLGIAEGIEANAGTFDGHDHAAEVPA